MKKRFFSIFLSTFVSVFLVAGFVFAAVTISSNIKVGSGTSDLTLNGDDVYVTGTFEVDGISRLDGEFLLNASSTITTPDATNLVNILTGNLKVGNGIPGITLNGEDAYIEGTFEVDGVSRLDGDVRFNGFATTTASNGNFDIGGTLTVNSSTSLVMGNATDWLYITTGNLKVGNGTPGTALNGEDAYIEGTLEVDGTSQFDGAVTLNNNILTVNASATIATPNASNVFNITTGNLKVGNAVPSLLQNGEDAYIEGNLEVDGALRVDNASTTFTSAATTTLRVDSSAAKGTCLVFKDGSGTIRYGTLAGNALSFSTISCE